MSEDNVGVFVPRWAMQDVGGDARDAMVLAQITWWLQPSQRDGSRRNGQVVERDGAVWLTMTDERLAREPGLSADQVYRARLSLRKRGLIEWQIRKVNGTRATLVRPILNRDLAESETATSRNSQTATSRNNPNRDLAVSSLVQEKDQDHQEKDVSPPAPTTTPRASRIPDPFYVSEEMREWAGQEVPGFDWKAETRKFVDYWRAAAGANARKMDWPATWRNWMRRAGGEARPGRGRATGSSRDRQADARLRLVDKLTGTEAGA